MTNFSHRCESTEQCLARSAAWTQESRNRFLVGFGLSGRIGLFILLCGLAEISSRAQTPDAGPPDSLRSMLSPPEPIKFSREDSLQALIESTERIRLERLAEQDGLTATSPADRTGAAEPDMNQGLETATSTSSSAVENTTAGRSLAEIRERIRILQRLRRESQQADSAEQSDADPMPTPQPTSANMPQSNQSSSQDELAERAIRSVETESSDATVNSDAGSVANDESKEIVSQQVLPSAANAFALGESLYRMGNYDAALKALLTVDASQLSQSDRTWLDLTIALCRRKIGDTDKALGTLREIANEDSTDYPVRAAKWWLKHADATLVTKQKLDAVSAEIDLLLERANQNVNDE